MSALADKIAAALDEAQTALDARTSEPWEVAESFGPDEPDDLYLVGPDEYLPAADALLIVSVVNRETRQIRMARALLEMAGELQTVPGTTVVIGNALVKALASVWLPDGAK